MRVMYVGAANSEQTRRCAQVARGRHSVGGESVHDAHVWHSGKFLGKPSVDTLENVPVAAPRRQIEVGVIGMRKLAHRGHHVRRRARHRHERRERVVLEAIPIKAVGIYELVLQFDEILARQQQLDARKVFIDDGHDECAFKSLDHPGPCPDHVLVVCRLLSVRSLPLVKPTAGHAKLRPQPRLVDLRP